MDGLSAVASVIAVIQISTKLVALCQSYLSEVKEAKKDIRRFRNEVATLEDILIDLQDLVDTPDGTKLPILDTSLKQCQLTLEELVGKLEKAAGKSKMMNQVGLRALKWPFTSNDVQKAIGTIERHKNMFNLALTADQTTLLRAIQINALTYRKDENHDKIVQWLSRADPSSNHHSACKKRQHGTGDWLINRADFEEWTRTPNSLLWLYGKMGCGKTILSSVIIEQLKAHCASKPNLAIAYFYFDFNESEKQNATSFVTTLIAQLCNHVVDLPEKLKELYKACNNGRGVATLDTLQAALFAVAEKFGDVFIVADALDECPNNGTLREELLELIKDMSTRPSSNIHLLVTSRLESDIEELLLSISTTRVIAIQGSPLDADIKSYICNEISSNPKLKKIPIEEQKKIEKRLIAGANGMFRWVFCQLDVLKKCKDKRALDKALESLPESLHKTYDRIFQNIDAQDQKKAWHALIWLVFSKRPLEIEEVANAAVLDPQAITTFDPDERLFDPNSILEILGSLVTRSSEDSSRKVIRLAHFSVQEYLVSEAIKNSEASKFGIVDIVPDHFIAEICLQYIFYYDESDVKTISEKDLETFPLLEYACQFWYDHTNAIPSKIQKPTDSILRLFLSDTALVSWLRVHVPDSGEKFLFKDLSNIATPLCYASTVGLETVVPLLLEKGADVDAKTASGETALQLAAKNGHAAVARLLLDRGAEVDSEDFLGRTPLYWATRRQHAMVIKLLLARNARKDKIDRVTIRVPAWAKQA